MASRLRDKDGARPMYVEARGASVFLWGRGYSYEFDKGLIMHVLAKEMGLGAAPATMEPVALAV